MSIIYKDTNVFEEAVIRVNMIFDDYDDIIVAMSGGKDSTVVFNIALQIARERNRLPLKVYWLDQEAEWQHTVDYMNSIMRMPEVKPLWFQIPFAFPNNLSTVNKTLMVWDPEQKDKWIHPQSDISIKECPFDISQENRDKAFYTLMNKLPDYCFEPDSKNCAVLSGMRTDESLHRRTAIMFGKAKFRGETWMTNKDETGKIRHQVFWPIYDFLSDDVWTAIAKNHWNYNKVYDFMYNFGIPKTNMRVSALVHETAWHAIEMLQEFEPKTYNRFTARIAGTSTFNHAFDEGQVIPKELPFMFKDWKEYRDYLLVHLIEPELQEHYKHEWEGQDGDEWYMSHVHEIILNDTCGTINNNFSSAKSNIKSVSDGKFAKRNMLEYVNLKEKNDGN